MHKVTMTFLATMALFSMSAAVNAAETPDSVDITKLTCRDYLLMDGDARDNTALFLHGYMAGKKSNTVVNVPNIATANDAILEGCVDKPEDALLSKFEAQGL